MTAWRRGSELPAAVQREALARFVHRYTREHVPQWALEQRNRACPVQFASDADWLRNTRFAVTKAGRLSERHRYCESSPTWPDGRSTRVQPVGAAMQSGAV